MLDIKFVKRISPKTNQNQMKWKDHPNSLHVYPNVFTL